MAHHVLTDGQRIRGAQWGCATSATVFAIGGYFNGCGYSAERTAELIRRAKERGDAMAGSIYTGATLTDSKAFYALQMEQAASAVTLADGDTAEIEGVTYLVRFNPGNVDAPRNSDPIRFIPV